MAPQRSTSITLRDIAEKAGCSKNTVSLALRDSPRISVARRTEIQQLARQMGYVPNIAARQLSTSLSGLIGVYARALNDAVRTDLVNSLVAELHSSSYRPLLGLGQGHRGPWRTAPWVQTFRQMNIEAIVVICEPQPEGPDWAKHLPKILVANEPNDELNCDYVALDRYQAGLQAGRHLLETGRRDVVVAVRPSSHFADGALDALADAQQPGRHLAEDDPPKLIERTLRECSTGPKRPDGVIFGDSPTAVQFLHQALQAGLRIPQDLAVLGYDYFPWSDMLAVPLTTIEQPIALLASRTVWLVQSRLETPDLPPRHETIEHLLVARQSTNPA